MLTEANRYHTSILSRQTPKDMERVPVSASVSIVMCLNYNSIFQNKDRFGFKICLKILC